MYSNLPPGLSVRDLPGCSNADAKFDMWCDQIYDMIDGDTLDYIERHCIHDEIAERFLNEYDYTDPVDAGYMAEQIDEYIEGLNER